MEIYEDLTNGGNQQSGGSSLRLRCPHCSTVGVFQYRHDLFWQSKVQNRAFNNAAGPRFCPNPACQKLVLFVSRGSNVLLSFPPEVLDFDATSVPDRVRSAIVEAIQCHAAQCYRASALMVRRTLEEICLDRNAEGKDLFNRIQALGHIVTLPKELLDSLHELRILGNDAAHIEAKTYDQIGQEEVEVAILLAKEIVKSTYQYADLLGRLRGLSKNGGAS
jgi:hypothetical protein